MCIISLASSWTSRASRIIQISSRNNSSLTTTSWWRSSRTWIEYLNYRPKPSNLWHKKPIRRCNSNHRSRKWRQRSNWVIRTHSRTCKSRRHPDFQTTFKLPNLSKIRWTSTNIYPNRQKSREEERTSRIGCRKESFKTIWYSNSWIRLSRHRSRNKD